jgi:hypothetical protein
LLKKWSPGKKNCEQSKISKVILERENFFIWGKQKVNSGKQNFTLVMMVCQIRELYLLSFAKRDSYSNIPIISTCEATLQIYQNTIMCLGMERISN